MQPQPPGFEEQVYEFEFEINANERQVWKWLNDTKTFTHNQIWPYKVEFYNPNDLFKKAGFEEGVVTNHFGPFINFAGILTEIQPEKYRDLQYYYGSYAVSFRWIRPYRLEFETHSLNGQTKIKGRISCYVKPFIAKIWLKLQKIFWKRFQKWATKHIKEN